MLAGLFVRSPHNVTLTAAGRTLLGRVAPAVREIDAGVEEASRVAAGRSGVLRVAFVSSLAAPAVPLIATAFRARTPGVELHLSERSMIEQLVDLRAGRVDIALFLRSEDVGLDERDLRVDVLVSGPQ